MILCGKETEYFCLTKRHWLVNSYFLFVLRWNNVSAFLFNAFSESITATNYSKNPLFSRIVKIILTLWIELFLHEKNLSYFIDHP